MADSLVHLQGQVGSLIDGLEFRKDEATESLGPLEGNPDFPDVFDRDRIEAQFLDSVDERRVRDGLAVVFRVVEQMRENRGRMEKLKREGGEYFYFSVKDTARQDGQCGQKIVGMLGGPSGWGLT